ncbi:MAG: UDP-N-acetylmuramate dehydrogenase [Tenericutes bacterium]|nr:UDP-N-acetylmuramate dehydrogenase [Mycoplasmatota bacterium]
MENVPLKNLTSYKLSGIASKVIFPSNVPELIELMKYIRKNHLKYKVIGSGSNLIFDGDYNGILIKLDKLDHLTIKNCEITVEAGYLLKKLALKACRLGLTGLEFATGIPGTVGGACSNNSGAYNSDMGYIVKSLKVLTPSLEIKIMENKELDYHYRTSFFEKNPEYIILEANIQLKKGNKQEILEIVEDRKKRRIASQPLEYPSAGSVFRNPTNNYAGKLIEDIGYKGKQKNDAMVSEKHANFIINKGNASGRDIIELINEIKEKVKQTYDIDLYLEQEIVK